MQLILIELHRKYNEKIDVKLLKKQTALNRCDMIERSLGEKYKLSLCSQKCQTNIIQLAIVIISFAGRCVE
jgi:hypothetical protein